MIEPNVSQTTHVESGAEVVVQQRPPMSVLGAILLTPLAAPFILPPLVLAAFGIVELTMAYPAAAQSPPTDWAWWQWPWGWPGARLVETFYVGLGSAPGHGGIETVHRAVVGFAVNGFIALAPLNLGLLTVAVLLRAWRWQRDGWTT